LELVEYPYNLHPQATKAKDSDGDLSIHIMPEDMPTQNDQLEARRFLVKKYPAGLRIKNEDGWTPLNVSKYWRFSIIANAYKEISDEFARSLKSVASKRSGSKQTRNKGKPDWRN
jgi:hypothetical protein